MAGELGAARRLRPASVRRVAVVGPGLDVIDRRDGYDFYPVQTIQPFAVVDSLLRLDLAVRGELQVTTFDLSPRVNGHLAGARRQADGGRGYTTHLPPASAPRWTPDVTGYWERFGNWIGESVDRQHRPETAACACGPCRCVRTSCTPSFRRISTSSCSGDGRRRPHHGL